MSSNSNSDGFGGDGPPEWAMSAVVGQPTIDRDRQAGLWAWLPAAQDPRREPGLVWRRAGLAGWSLVGELVVTGLLGLGGAVVAERVSAGALSMWWLLLAGVLFGGVVELPVRVLSLLPKWLAVRWDARELAAQPDAALAAWQAEEVMEAYHDQLAHTERLVVRTAEQVTRSQSAS